MQKSFIIDVWQDSACYVCHVEAHHVVYFGHAKYTLISLKRKWTFDMNNWLERENFEITFLRGDLHCLYKLNVFIVRWYQGLGFCYCYDLLILLTPLIVTRVATQRCLKALVLRCSLKKLLLGSLQTSQEHPYYGT